MRHKRNIIVDTNIIISALLNPGSIPRQVVDFVFCHDTIIASLETFIEAHEKVIQPKFNAYISASDRKYFFEQLFSLSTFIDITSHITDCRDPKDNKFLELAIDGQADYVITGDQDLLVLTPFRGIPILSAREFLEAQENR